MKTIVKNISFTRGNSYGLKITLKNNAININNIYFTVKDKNDQKILEKKLYDGITFENNVIILELKPKDTDNLIDDIPYKYDMQIDYGTDDEWTAIKGTFIVSWKATD